MRFYSFLFLFVFLNSVNVFSQEKNIEHTVSKGETISEIAKYYNVKPSEIYDLNPEARNGIKYKAILLIPSNAKKNTAVSTTDSKINREEITYEVQPKETLYGIAKQHNITIEELYKINPDLEKEGLKIGQIIKVPQTSSDKSITIVKQEKTTEIKQTNVKKEVVVVPKKEEKKEIPTEVTTYEVLAKESLYSIARQHEITLAELQNANPELANQTLRVGQKINIPVKANTSSSLITEKKEIKKNPENKIVVEDKKVESEITREVLAKETKYGIAKEYGLTVAELEKQNPEIVKGLSVGYMLKIRSSKAIENKVPVQEVKEDSSNKELVTIANKMYNVELVDKLIATASENMGTRYRSGGTTKDGFDCSGLMFFTFSTNDIKLPRSSTEMANYGEKIDADKAQKGDLIFFKTTGGSRISHVGMVVEVLEGEIKFIHSSTSSGVMVSSTKESYYEKRFVQVNHVLQ